MKSNYRKGVVSMVFLGLSSLAFIFYSTPSWASSTSAIDDKVSLALEKLYDDFPGAKALSYSAKGILVFPSIIKGGFIFAGQYGEGSLIEGGKAIGYYNSTAASWGLQAGITKFGYVLFFMEESDLNYLKTSKGWELGVGPSIVIVDTGMAKTLTTTTAKKGVYAFIFNQRGLMAGVGIQGSKITKVKR